ncbi:hypothetical protein ELP00_17555 [Salmonella enterica subsp. enterica serovar Kiambu]|nr:hypothetical protein [Salmonella enterica subsp. enterica serovar Kiambu]
MGIEIVHVGAESVPLIVCEPDVGAAMADDISPKEIANPQSGRVCFFTYIENKIINPSPIQEPLDI